MAFTTKLDFSNNRQVKQHIETTTILSGATNFGVSFGDLPTGPNLSTSAQTEFFNVVTSTFSGNNTTTNYNWYDSRMQLGISELSAITLSNSATTQTVNPIFGVANTTVIDGNIVALDYSGVTFDVTPIAMVDLGGGNYSGTVSTLILSILSASTLDFTGRTIWVDVSGITRTQDLIITSSGNTGDVWTKLDSEGRGYWSPSTGGSGYWSGGSGTDSVVLINSNITNTLSANTVYAPSLTLKKSGTSRLGINTDPSGTIDIVTENGKSKLYTIDNISTVQTLTYSGDSASLTNITIASPNIGGLSLGVVGSSASYPDYGVVGDSFVYSSNASFGLNIISSDGTGTADYIRFYAGQGAANTPSMHIHGTGSTKGYVAINGVTPSVHLDVNGNGRFRSIGSGASAGVLNYTADGTLTVSTSDERLKTNIVTIENPLDIINKMRGVSFNWIGQEEENSKFGFIAQEVKTANSKLVFTNQATEEKYMGVHYDGVIPILVEAMKEIISGDFIRTQTIVAEDNNIELNFNGNRSTSIGGGIKVLNALEGKSADLIIDSNGDWTTNNGLIPTSLTIPEYTPISSTDELGNAGNITRDNDYIYIKTSTGWKRANLESF